MALWKLRNEVIAHGNRELMPPVMLELLEGSFDAARLAYDALNAALPGLDLPGPPQSWFMTDLMMLMASGDHAHQAIVDIGVEQDTSGDWIATWPSTEQERFRSRDYQEALDRARDRATATMRQRARIDPEQRPVRSEVVI
jgi:hypothetical protein